MPATAPAAASRRLLLGAAALLAAAFSVHRLAVPGSDDVSASEAARRRAALAGTRLPPGQRRQLLLALKTRPLHLAWLPVFDSGAEDADIIRVRTLGLSETVRLAKRIVAVPVLLAPDARINITGVDQGMGGGVTLGIVSNGVPLKLPPLAVGGLMALDAIPKESP